MEHDLHVDSPATPSSASGEIQGLIWTSIFCTYMHVYAYVIPYKCTLTLSISSMASQSRMQSEI